MYSSQNQTHAEDDSSQTRTSVPTVTRGHGWRIIRRQAMTNYERIKSMTIDEMAEFLCHGDFDCEKCAYKDNKKGCKDEVNRYKKWLEDEEEK